MVDVGNAILFYKHICVLIGCFSIMMNLQVNAQMLIKSVKNRNFRSEDMLKDHYSWCYDEISWFSKINSLYFQNI